ncbi:hypothetical protein [Wenzhou picorna-like virus 16]|uniref:hypothetical protein n=1 Tax=Wenzhou picorna-like virus 16 TaxID=1923600 RepID=UPI00090A6719|nr:hypothetical protein [Wenzhou picorna-like virus 16]APG78525.1 hypothetical protein [Wenzhou picorna-like virus 16]
MFNKTRNDTGKAFVTKQNFMLLAILQGIFYTCNVTQTEYENRQSFRSYKNWKMFDDAGQLEMATWRSRNRWLTRRRKDRANKLDREGLTKRLVDLRHSEVQVGAFEFTFGLFLRKYGIDNEFIIDLLEDLLFLAYNLTHINALSDVVVALTMFVKSRNKQSMYKTVTAMNLDQYVQNLFYSDEEEVQGFESCLGSVRSLLNKYNTAKNTILFKKIQKFISYAILFDVLHLMGIKAESSRMDGVVEKLFCAQNKVEREWDDFIYHALDTIVFIMERGVQCYKLGRFDPILHSGSNYLEWEAEASELIRLSKFTTNNETLGMSLFEYLGRLDQAIEKGTAISQYDPDVTSAKYVKSLLNEMKAIKLMEVNRKSAQQEREAPFSLLVYGQSSVGKSMFSRLLFCHFAKAFGLPLGDEYRYVRNPVDEYWTNFRTQMWCVQLDDIAFLNPDAANGVDPSMKEMIQVVNNVPFVPTQADLADKGKTPCKCSLVIATTNTKHLNAKAYFSCPVATQRRLPWIVTIRVKREFARKDGSIDPAKCKLDLAEGYPNVWEIHVQRVVIRGMQDGILEDVEDFSNIHEFLAWYCRMAKVHRDEQVKAMATAESLKEGKVCPACFYMETHCKCSPQVQTDDFNDGNLMYRDDMTVDELIRWREQEERRADITARRGFFRVIWDGLRNNIHIRLPAIFMTVQCVIQCRVFAWIIWLVGNPALIGAISTYRFISGICWVITFFGVLNAHQKYKLDLFIKGMERAAALGNYGPRIKFAATLAGLALVVPSTYKLVSMFFPGFKIAGVDHKMTLRDELHYNGKKYKEWYISMDHALSRHELTKEPLDEIITTVETYYKEKITRDVDPAMVAYFAERGVKLPQYHYFASKGEPQAQEKVRLSEQIGVMPKPRDDERKQVWFNDSYETTSYDVGRKTLSWKSLPWEQVQEHVSKNVVTLVSTRKSEGGTKKRVVRALCLGGHTYVTNAHGLPNEVCEVEITQDLSKDGINRNIKFLYNPAMSLIDTERDIMFVSIQNLPPKRSLLELFPKNSTYDGIFNGMYISRSLTGASEVLEVKNITKSPQVSIDKLNISVDIFHGYCERQTEKGFCGSTLVAKTPQGPVILGIHVLGGQGHVTGALALDQEYISKQLDTMWNVSKQEMVQSGEFHLSATGKERIVSDLHMKSPIRYIEEGAADVFGSFLGFRPTSASRVEESLLCASALKRGYVINTGPPVMRGWQPWRCALLDMVNQKFHIDPLTLEHCVEAFTKDITSKLSLEDYEDLVILNNMSAINGVPGVAYLDRIKRSSSMGNPWKTRKVNYLVHDPEGIFYGLPDAVKFTDEIYDRIDTIMDLYSQGIRYHPNFCAHLKDEPVSHEKILSAKTRVFTGSPVDWSIVVRKYLLTYIRVMQNNRFIFEAGVGTITQSLEWQQIRDYLVKHGEHKIIAGDYSKFDKHMTADIILAAFKVIKNVLRQAGWSDEELRVIQCIAEDTAFPLVDFNGDLIQFYGTNPSGHPLTVIINSMVNSLYMRLAYCALNPEGTCFDFQENVSLMTYGDDNIMGVSDKTPWFNHTDIQSALGAMGVIYTMADKEAESKPYLHLSETSFLKRTWRWDEDVGAYLAPLDHASMDKMMTMWIPSGTICPEAQAIAIIGSAIREYFFYGKDVYEEKRVMFLEIIEECGLKMFMKKSTLPTWESLRQLFWESSEHVDLEIQSRDYFDSTNSSDISGDSSMAISEEDVEELPMMCDRSSEGSYYVTEGEWDLMHVLLGPKRRMLSCRSIEVKPKKTVVFVYCADGSMYRFVRESVDAMNSPGRSPKSLFRDVTGWFTKMYTRLVRLGQRIMVSTDRRND